MFLFVFCNKTGSYVLIQTYKELNSIDAAESPNVSILQPNELWGGRNLEPVCVQACVGHPWLHKVVSTVMVLYCDWSSYITAGQSMGCFEKMSLCRCVCVSILDFGMHRHLIYLLWLKSTWSPEGAQTKKVKPLHVWLSRELTRPPHTPNAHMHTLHPHLTPALYQETQYLNCDIII